MWNYSVKPKDPTVGNIESRRVKREISRARLRLRFAQTSLANCHDNLQVFIVPTADDHLAKTSPFETSLGTSWDWRDS